MIKNVNPRSEEVQEILTRPPHWMIRSGSAIIFSITIFILALLWIIKYPDIITAEVIVTTQIPPQRLIAKNPGRIEKILIKNNEYVDKNTVLAIIENTANYKDVLLLRKICDSVQINSKFIFPFNKLNNSDLGEIEGAYVEFEKNYTAYSLNLDLHPHWVDGSAQNNETTLLKERFNLLLQQKKIAEQELVIKRKELERYQNLHNKGVIASQEWDTKNLEYLQVEKNYRNINSSLSETKSSMNNLSRDSKTTKINETKDDVILYSNVIQSFNLLKKAISEWEINYVLSSSIPGKVSFLRVWVENQTVTAGDNVFAIIPAHTSNYVAKVKAGVKNSGKIKPGQKVNIRLSNYPDREFGILRGQVLGIASTPDKDGTILIDVSLPHRLRTTYNKNLDFHQEMSGSADIITSDLRLFERLMYEFRELSRVKASNAS